MSWSNLGLLDPGTCVWLGASWPVTDIHVSCRANSSHPVCGVCAVIRTTLVKSACGWASSWRHLPPWRHRGSSPASSRPSLSRYCSQRSAGSPSRTCSRWNAGVQMQTFSTIKQRQQLWFPFYGETNHKNPYSSNVICIHYTYMYMYVLCCTVCCYMYLAEYNRK